MYLAHFGLDDAPFGLTPDPAFAFASRAQQQALNTLLRAVRGGAGLIKVTGEVGRGKTLLCRRVLAALAEADDTATDITANAAIDAAANPAAAGAPRYLGCHLPHPCMEPRMLLLALATELGGAPLATESEFGLLRQLEATLRQRAAAGQRVVVCLDEAQALPPASLETLRLLSNLEADRHALVQLLLFGQPELDSALAQPGARPLRQRVACHDTLGTLQRDELPHYLAHRLRVAGHGRDTALFSDAATQVLHRAGRGTPRLVNLLAHKALLLLCSEGGHTVLARHVRAAARDTADAAALRPPHWPRVVLGAALAASAAAASVAAVVGGMAGTAAPVASFAGDGATRMQPLASAASAVGASAGVAAAAAASIPAATSAPVRTTSPLAERNAEPAIAHSAGDPAHGLAEGRTPRLPTPPAFGARSGSTATKSLPATTWQATATASMSTASSTSMRAPVPLSDPASAAAPAAPAWAAAWASAWATAQAAAQSAPASPVTAPVSVPGAAPAAGPVAALASVPATAAAPTNAAFAAPAMPTGPVRIDKITPQRSPRERADALYQQGLAAHQAGGGEDASTAFAAALQADAGFVAARQALAGQWHAQGRSDEAQALLAEGLARGAGPASPASLPLSLTLARLQAERADPRSAADTLNAARPAAEASPPAARAEWHGLYAAVLQRAGRHAEAAGHYEAALRLLPSNGLWWLGLGLSRAAEGRTEAARDALQRARSSGELSPELAAFVEQRLKLLG